MFNAVGFILMPPKKSGDVSEGTKLPSSMSHDIKHLRAVAFFFGIKKAIVEAALLHLHNEWPPDSVFRQFQDIL